MNKINRPETGEIIFWFVVVGCLSLGIILSINELIDWVGKNQEALQAIQYATATAEALKWTPTTIPPTPETTPTPDTAQLLATAQSILATIQP